MNFALLAQKTPEVSSSGPSLIVVFAAIVTALVVFFVFGCWVHRIEEKRKDERWLKRQMAKRRFFAEHSVPGQTPKRSRAQIEDDIGGLRMKIGELETELATSMQNGE